VDKLARAVNDGLSGAAFQDDSQVIRMTASKEYSDTPGVDIEISDEFDCL